MTAEAARCAKELLRSGDEESIRRLRAHAHAVSKHGGLGKEGERALAKVVAAASCSYNGEKQRALAALVYLHNPFDDQADSHPELGFEDDAQVLIATARNLR